jgi:hypothetical protein
MSDDGMHARVEWSTGIRRNTMNTFSLRSGLNKGNRRIWIEGTRLLDAGLIKGTALYRMMDADGSMILTNVEIGGAKRHTIAGNDARPILDLCGKWVTAFIGDHTHFTVEVDTYSPAVDMTAVTLIITPVTI